MIKEFNSQFAPLPVNVVANGGSFISFKNGEINIDLNEVNEIAKKLNLAMEMVYKSILAHECGHYQNYISNKNNLDFARKAARDELLAWQTGVKLFEENKLSLPEGYWEIASYCLGSYGIFKDEKIWKSSSNNPHCQITIPE